MSAHRHVVSGTDAPPSLVDEQSFVDRIRGGDADAFAVVFHAYYQPLCNYLLLYLDSAAEAEECVQDVMFWLWSQRDRLVLRGGLRSYLYVAARNRGINVLKHQRVTERWAKRAAADVHLAGVGQGPPTTEVVASAREIDAAVERALADLPKRRRIAFTLAWRHGLTSAEIARIMGISLKGVEMARARALAALRRALKAFR